MWQKRLGIVIEVTCRDTGPFSLYNTQGVRVWDTKGPAFLRIKSSATSTFLGLMELSQGP